VAVVFDTDPELGITEYWDYDPINDTFAIVTEQEVTPFLDRMQKIRNECDVWGHGIKEEWLLYASIPTVVELELLKKGLRLDRKEDHKAIFKEINTNYPNLKAVNKKHTG